MARALKKQTHIRLDPHLEEELRAVWIRTFEQHQIGSFPVWIAEVALRDALKHRPK